MTDREKRLVVKDKTTFEILLENSVIKDSFYQEPKDHKIVYLNLGRIDNLKEFIKDFAELKAKEFGYWLYEVEGGESQKPIVDELYTTFLNQTN